MDYRAIAELIWMSLLGFSVLTLTVGLTLRFALKPFVRDIARAIESRGTGSDPRTNDRVARIERRIADLEEDVHRALEVGEFHRELRAAPDEAPEGS